jgi:hypothetical protein
LEKFIAAALGGNYHISVPVSETILSNNFASSRAATDVIKKFTDFSSIFYAVSLLFCKNASVLLKTNNTNIPDRRRYVQSFENIEAIS